MIRVENLSLRYPAAKEEVLNNLWIEFRQGEIVLISGRSGAGKSSLVNCISGIIPHFVKADVRGSVQIFDSSPWNQPLWKTSRMLGVLLQNAGAMTFTDKVEDEIAFGLENIGISPPLMARKIAESLNLTEVAHLKYRYLKTLSSGELQRVVIASLLALNQPFLILDEPLAFLDGRSRINLVNLLSKLASKGKGIIVIEHRSELFDHVQCRRFSLNAGKLATVLEDEEPSLPRIVTERSTGETRLIFEDVDFSWDRDSECNLLTDISFEVRAGESVVVRGQNGSGKTTLFLLAMGFVHPQKGRIFNCGVDVSSSKPSKVGGSCAVVFQIPQSQLFMQTVMEEVRARAGNEHIALEELKALKLDNMAHRHPRSLSTGQMRRLTLAAALAARPRLLLLDEPSVGQDDGNLSIIIQRLKRFVEEGGALLTATHDERVAKTLASRELILEQGTIKESRRREDEESGKVDHGFMPGACRIRRLGRNATGAGI